VSTERVLEQARGEAARLGHDVLASEHVLLAVIGHDQVVREALESSAVDVAALARALEAGNRKVRPRGEAPAEGLPLSSHARRLLEGTDTAGNPGVAILLAALKDRRAPVSRALQEQGVAPEQLVIRLGGKPGASAAEPRAAPAVASMPAAPPTPGPADPPARPKEASRREPAAERKLGQRDQSRERAARDRARPEKSARAENPDSQPPGTGERPLASKPPSVGKLAPPPRENLSWGRYLLLAAVPAAVALTYTHQSPVLVFFVACLGVLPLAGFMGEATEHIAARTGPAMGGLLNATFGNAAELIIAIVALRAGLIDLVKASIIGSILGNLLLILGLSIVAGGVSRPQLRFSRTNAGMSAGMLCLAVVSLVLPTLFSYIHPEPSSRSAALYLSEGIAGILLVTYAASLWFSLKTHKRLFGGDPHPVTGTLWSLGKAGGILALATVGVAVMSEILVHSVEAVTASLGLSQVFLGLIIIPLIGNAAEHATAVVVARKGQMDLALQIALGSSTQIALLVAPILVFAGLIVGRNMNLVFGPLQVIVLFLATLVSTIVTLDGESNWFEGVQLLAVYAMIATAAYFI
jgi:Ca2+:H+ antiporter